MQEPKSSPEGEEQGGAMLLAVIFPDSVSFCCNNPMFCVL